MATGSSDLHLVVILVLVFLVVPSMNRTCGGCTLRCKLLPARELKKLANTRCQHHRTEICKYFARAAASEIRMSQRLQRKTAILVAIVDANVIFESNGGSSYYNECSYCDAVTVRNSFNDAVHDCSLPS